MSNELHHQPLEWYDVRTKFKKIIRSIGYSVLVREIICSIIYLYMRLVYHSSKKTFIGEEHVLEMIRKKQPMILCMWHHSLMMMPFVVVKAKKTEPSFNTMTLASKHGDGRFVSAIMSKFGFINIAGSTQNNNKGGIRKASRGIDLVNFRKIFQGLKNGLNLAITPDGPRGPKCKINSHIAAISKIAGVPLLAASCVVSRNKKLRTWDEFRIPLPFSRIVYAFEDFIWVAKDASEEDTAKVNKLLEEKINLVEIKAEQLVKSDKINSR